MIFGENTATIWQQTVHTKYNLMSRKLKAGSSSENSWGYPTQPAGVHLLFNKGAVRHLGDKI